MALDAPQLQRIAGLIAGADSVREAATAIRQAFPPLRALVVDALDVRSTGLSDRIKRTLLGSDA
jgi:hypothetical protein